MQKPLLSTSSEDHEVIWKRTLAGHVSAFETLMDSHFRLLFEYGLKFSDDEEFVKDNIQDLFLYVWEKRRNLNTNIPVKPYLMASLRRMMHRASNTALVYNPSLENHPTLFDVKFSVEKEYIRRETTRLMSLKLKTTLEKLPPRQKEVVYLKFFQELNRDQIATVMNISPQTVSNLLQIAMKQLRKHWKAQFATSSLMLAN
ncbi:RNA polymerase sigma factor [Salmonirosea aquatica]|uniref:Sigma-70 family RNA polymerase sigma factor n=1 Tax=Salmonirosea aquatica TaxID=2654236 RepID=A0A7C9FAW8_9BACT|nr:sigma-70 family RNA polymerase sigma factor [Cytophagaceae bacterium SJW1-29]